MNKNVKYFFVIFFCFIAFHVNAQNDQRTIKSFDPFIQSCLADVNSDSLYSYTLSLQSFGTRYCLADNRKSVALWLAAKLESFGYNTIIDSFPCTFEIHINDGGGTFHVVLTQYNVIGTLWGTQNPAATYILGAHYDSFAGWDSITNPLISAPGADDNATGVAAFLEISRILKARNYCPKYSIEFIGFAAEELMGSSYSGSKHYAHLCDSLNKDIKMMINADMLGYPGDTTNTVNIMGYIGHEWISALADTLRLQYCSINSQIYNDQKVWDAYPFWADSFPAIGFIERNPSFNPNYHKVTDIVDNIDFDYFREITKLIFALLLDRVPFDSAAGVSPIDLENSLTIYPNPCNEYIWIKYLGEEQKSPLTIEIRDLMNRRVFSTFVQDGILPIRLTIPEIKPSIYYIYLLNKNGVLTGLKKFVKIE
ncbi:MAG: M20/M25/M40 family metallo-hydrolase [Bacteroidales bacterium]|jgi:hypothetical protein|nr:M20/M25/M40 family metallo-hydrolase [Bacteroidales bacterium]MDD4215443.1 M20/M25/M40 family metallo-hydrolase [Bacteroidales bacterium]